MKFTQTLLSAVILSTSLFTATASAALVPALGGQVVNDTDLNITWLANANLAATNTFGLATNVSLGTDSYGNQSIIYSGGATSGLMTWGGAQKWIAAMNAANYLGYSDWRLPATGDTGTPGGNFSYNGTDSGFNSTGSEMAHLYYNELGNKGYYNTAGVVQSGYGLVNDPANPNDESLFSNFQSSYYWSGTENALFPDWAWYFSFNSGLQNDRLKYYVMYALAVRSGQVVATPVPGAAWLLGSGLLGLIGLGRRITA